MGNSVVNDIEKKTNNTGKSVNNSDKEKKIKDGAKNDIANTLTERFNQQENEMKKMFGEKPTQKTFVEHFSKGEKYKGMNYQEILESLESEDDQNLKNIAKWGELNIAAKEKQTEKKPEKKTEKEKDNDEEIVEEEKKIENNDKSKDNNKPKGENKTEKEDEKKKDDTKKVETKKEAKEEKEKKEKGKGFFGSIKSAFKTSGNFVWNGIKYLPRNVLGTLGLGRDMIGAIPAEMFGGKGSIKKSWDKFTNKWKWDYKKQTK